MSMPAWRSATGWSSSAPSIRLGSCSRISRRTMCASVRAWVARNRATWSCCRCCSKARPKPSSSSPPCRNLIRPISLFSRNWPRASVSCSIPSKPPCGRKACCNNPRSWQPSCKPSKKNCSKPTTSWVTRRNSSPSRMPRSNARTRRSSRRAMPWKKRPPSWRWRRNTNRNFSPTCRTNCARRSTASWSWRSSSRKMPKAIWPSSRWNFLATFTPRERISSTLSAIFSTYRRSNRAPWQSSPKKFHLRACAMPSSAASAISPRPSTWLSTSRWTRSCRAVWTPTSNGSSRCWRICSPMPSNSPRRGEWRSSWTWRRVVGAAIIRPWATPRAWSLLKSGTRASVFRPISRK